jgi:hypothetical protein
LPITEPFTGTEVVGTTEWSLTADAAGPAAVATDGLYQVLLDLSALAAGDVFEFRLYEKVRAGLAQRRLMTATFAGVQADPAFASPGLMLLHGWDATLIKISGTDRAIDWSVRSVT